MGSANRPHLPVAALQADNQAEPCDRPVRVPAVCHRSRQCCKGLVPIRVDLDQTSPHRLYSREKHAHEKARKRPGVLRWTDHPPEPIQAPNALFPQRLRPNPPPPHRTLPPPPPPPPPTQTPPFPIPTPTPHTIT